ncbi:hypothetical protein SU69_03990 [Thermosipho melanesiensis]|uniref:DUF72 domain-containing protein n=2 Tax=Thermosipho melanesiensis TaxID=46541 RepID=A6LL39_THEM4|nr:DUF72 domain-containing protein [Thermosipho melanesiensis]ABR30640.1 protein of unknown function DUF72 [Thermosipho melanesiensis BI429]APT73778.1 hypothetical protein BW47_04200 [Thermosipho melanesiensis]OOC35717.1 hypothetical protein SU68_04045 [Thermosipho melanesiensis]OOC39016.1 hypothetical protein SU69_03990 [Thermosipho melanesiensis]OOC39164.1 hypothetical protein SU70_03990 [Thermosipho melanesiensis]
MTYIGTSGFQFDDWIGKVYPNNIKKSNMLRFYVWKYRFNTVELNYTFYRMPSYKSIVSLLRNTPNNFLFSVKLFGGITHEREIDYVENFLKATKEIEKEKRLVGYLAQFPFSFKRNKDNEMFLYKLSKKINNLFVEFRHVSWKDFKTDDFEIITIDQPKLKDFYPFQMNANKRLYVRLHGRNTKWFESNAKTRYNYKYKREELLTIYNEIKEFKGEKYIYFNNCYNGYALLNALEFRKIIGGEELELFRT